MVQQLRELKKLQASQQQEQENFVRQHKSEREAQQRRYDVCVLVCVCAFVRLYSQRTCNGCVFVT